MKDALKINPLVFRLCTFDPEALNYVEEAYQVPRQVVIAFIVSLANLNSDIVDLLLEKDKYRLRYQELKKNRKKTKDSKLTKKQERLNKLMQEAEKIGIVDKGKKEEDPQRAILSAANLSDLGSERSREPSGDDLQGKARRPRRPSLDTETYESSACETLEEPYGNERQSRHFGDFGDSEQEEEYWSEEE